MLNEGKASRKLEAFYFLFSLHALTFEMPNVLQVYLVQNILRNKLNISKLFLIFAKLNK